MSQWSLEGEESRKVLPCRPVRVAEVDQKVRESQVDVRDVGLDTRSLSPEGVWIQPLSLSIEEERLHHHSCWTWSRTKDVLQQPKVLKISNECQRALAFRSRRLSY